MVTSSIILVDTFGEWVFYSFLLCFIIWQKWLKLAPSVIHVHTVVKASHTEVDYRAIQLKTIFQRNKQIIPSVVATANPS